MNNYEQIEIFIKEWADNLNHLAAHLPEERIKGMHHILKALDVYLICLQMKDKK